MDATATLSIRAGHPGVKEKGWTLIYAWDSLHRDHTSGNIRCLSRVNSMRAIQNSYGITLDKDRGSSDIYSDMDDRSSQEKGRSRKKNIQMYSAMKQVNYDYVSF